MNHYLDPNHEFLFTCTSCGDCCKNRDNLLLTSRDLYKLAKNFKKSTQQIIREYCNAQFIKNSNVPRFLLSPIGTEKKCPFLVKNTCSVYDIKPTLCSLYPLGRLIDYTQNSSQIKYTRDTVLCGTQEDTYTIKTWLVKNKIPFNDEFFYLWNNLIYYLEVNLNIIKETIGGENRQLIQLQEVIII